MSKCNSFEEDLLKLIFHNVDIANIGDAAGLQNSAAAGSLYIALFTANPTESGSFTNEATYTGYARKAVSRASGEWTISGDDPTNCKNTNAITFDECTGGSNTLTHFGICKSLSGTGSSEMMYYGALDASLAVSSGITPQFAALALDVQEA